MAQPDPDRRTARDYMRDARTRYDNESLGTKWAGFSIGLALIGFIRFMLFAPVDLTTTGDATRELLPQTFHPWWRVT